MKRIQIDDEIQQLLVSRAVDLGETPSNILRRELHLIPPADTIEIEDDIYRFLVSKAVALGESASSILRRELGLSANHERAPSIVEFSIHAGTAGQAWNSREVAVVATVGDTLRIVNNDSVSHRLHTGGAPFPHPNSDILPGQSSNFVITARSIRQRTVLSTTMALAPSLSSGYTCRWRARCHASGLFFACSSWKQHNRSVTGPRVATRHGKQQDRIVRNQRARLRCTQR